MLFQNRAHRRETCCVYYVGWVGMIGGTTRQQRWERSLNGGNAHDVAER